MNVMILGAGRGTRLGEISLKTPKILVDISGRPLLARQFDYLEAQGARRVVVNTFHLADDVERFVAGYDGGLDVRVSREPRLLGTAGGVRYALDLLGAEPFIVLYGDVLTNEPLMPLLRSHEIQGASVTLGVYESSEVADKGLLTVDPQGFVVEFIEKNPEAIGPALISGGIYAVEPELVREWPYGHELDFGLDVFPRLLAQGHLLAIHRLTCPLYDIGTPTMLEAGRQHQLTTELRVRGSDA